MWWSCTQALCLQRKVKPFISTQRKCERHWRKWYVVHPALTGTYLWILICAHIWGEKGFDRYPSWGCCPLVFCRACHRMCCLPWILTQGTSSLNTALVNPAAKHQKSLLRISLNLIHCKTGEVEISALSQRYQSTISFLTTFLVSSTYPALHLAAVSFPCWKEFNLKNKRSTVKDPGWDLRNPQTWEWYCHFMNKTKMKC